MLVGGANGREANGEDGGCGDGKADVAIGCDHSWENDRKAISGGGDEGLVGMAVATHHGRKFADTGFGVGFGDGIVFQEKIVVVVDGAVKGFAGAVRHGDLGERERIK